MEQRKESRGRGKACDFEAVAELIKKPHRELARPNGAAGADEGEQTEG